MRKTKRTSLSGALCALFFLSFSAFAQSDVASISGFVRDSSNAVVPNAKVVIRNEGVEFEKDSHHKQRGLLRGHAACCFAGACGLAGACADAVAARRT